MIRSIRFRTAIVLSCGPVELVELHDWLVPFIEVWTQESLPWASTPAVHRFATQPEFEGYARLIEAFARHGARPA